MFILLMRQTLSGSRVSLLSFLAMTTKLSRVEDKLDSTECKLEDIATGLGVLNQRIESLMEQIQAAKVCFLLMCVVFCGMKLHPVSR